MGLCRAIVMLDAVSAENHRSGYSAGDGQG